MSVHRVPIIVLLWAAMLVAQQPPASVPAEGQKQSAQPAVDADEVTGPVYRVGGDVLPAKTIYAPDPSYSSEAAKERLEGTVILWTVVGTDGMTHNIKVARSVGMGLDEQAINAVKTWKFQPATKNGVPVAVQINIEVNFRLYDQDFADVVDRVTRDMRDPESLLERAERGDRGAQMRVGYAYFTGTVLVLDHGKGVAWLEKAVEQGSATAAFLLGYAYKDNHAGNRTTAKNSVNAYKWLLVARRTGLLVKDRVLKNVEGMMRPGELAEAQTAADDFLAAHKMKKDLP